MVQKIMKHRDRKSINNILGSIKRDLSMHYGKRLISVILYGSYAKGTQRPESDIDIAVVLKGGFDKYEEVEDMVDLTSDVSLENDILISILPITSKEYQIGNYQIFKNIRREGMAL